MTHVIIAVDGNTFIHKDSEKSPGELSREIQMGTFESPVCVQNPTFVQLQNIMLVAEDKTASLLSPNQRAVLDMMANGATDKEMANALQLSLTGIRHHVNSLKRKFNAVSREELVAKYCSFRHC
ncbi:MAG: helix-turn-helix transcriptional regulator [Anaerolineaceae bacterium]|nr:helix-turn-helix transcriptional regulator [Anaerolineaceae bacterium]